MMIVGLTGSMAMGKSLTGKYFKELGVPLFDADITVHKLYETDSKVISSIKKLYPKAVSNNKINRSILTEYAQEKDNLKKIEEIVHPAVKKKQQAFIATAKKNKEPLIILDVPLLFEAGANELCDKIIVVTAPWYIQLYRAIKRKGMSFKKFFWLKKQQISCKEKCRRANYVIYTNQPKHKTKQKVKQIYKQLMEEAKGGK